MYPDVHDYNLQIFGGLLIPSARPAEQAPLALGTSRLCTTLPESFRAALGLGTLCGIAFWSSAYIMASINHRYIGPGLEYVRVSFTYAWCRSARRLRWRHLVVLTVRSWFRISLRPPDLGFFFSPHAQQWKATTTEVRRIRLHGQLRKETAEAVSHEFVLGCGWKEFTRSRFVHATHFLGYSKE